MSLMSQWQPFVLGMEARRVGYDYEFRCESPPVIFNISHITESHSELRAEVQISSVQTGNIGPILRDRLSLLSQRAKASLAKSIREVTDREAPWGKMVEAIAMAAVDDYRLGEPAVLLWEVEATDKEEYLIERFLPLGEPMVLYGDGGTCKSWTAMFMAIAVATGRSLPGLKVRQSPQAVLYLDWETTAAVQKRRMARACAGLGIEPPKGQFYYRRMVRGLADDLRRIKEIVDRREIGFVIVDSMGAACGGEPDKAEVALHFFGALRELGPCTIQVISHITHASAETTGKALRPFGSVYTRNGARSAWSVVKTSEPDSDISDVGLFHTKVNDTRIFAPQGFRYTFTDDKTSIQTISADTIASFRDHVPYTIQIAGVLKQYGAMTAKDIAEELGAKVDTIKSTLSRMDNVIRLHGGQGRGKEAHWGMKVHNQEIPF